MRNRVEIVDILLNFGANPLAMNSNGETALIFACFQENLIICQKLIAARSKVNHKDNYGRSPLLICVRYNK